MPLTTKWKLPYFAFGDPPSLHGGLQNLAVAAETALTSISTALDTVKRTADAAHAARVYGELGYAENRAQRGANDVVGDTQINGLICDTVAVTEARKVMVLAEGQATSNAANTQIDFRVVKTGADNVVREFGGWRTVLVINQDNGQAFNCSLRTTINPGNTRFAVQFRRSGGSGGCYITPDLAYIRVDDAGPVS